MADPDGREARVPDAGVAHATDPGFPHATDPGVPHTTDPGVPPEPTPMLALDEEAIDLSDLRPSDGVVLVVFWVLAGVVFLQFFTRYVLNDSLAWTEEIARFLLIGTTFVGAIMATRKQAHIAVEFIYRWVPRTGRRVMQTAIDLANVAFFAMLAVFSAQIAGRTRQMMVSIDVPKASLYWIVALCFALMALYAAALAYRHLRDGTSRLIDPALHADAIRAAD